MLCTIKIIVYIYVIIKNIKNNKIILFTYNIFFIVYDILQYNPWVVLKNKMHSCKNILYHLLLINLKKFHQKIKNNYYCVLIIIIIYSI